MEVLTFTPTDYFGSNTYLTTSGTESAVIDPSVNVSRFEPFFSNSRCELKYIILTHGHFDHISEINSWVLKFPNAKVIVGAGDKNMLSDSYLNCYKLFMGVDKGYYGECTTVSDGDVLHLGNDEFTVIETPGHTPGSISLLTKDSVFVGDTVFAGGGFGRCDLPGGDFYVLEQSLDKIFALPQHLTVYSGHGEPTKISKLK